MLNKPRTFTNAADQDRLYAPTDLQPSDEAREMVARAVDQGCIEQVTLQAEPCEMTPITSDMVICSTCGDSVPLAETIICQCPCECQKRICYIDAKLGLYECPDCDKEDATC